MEQRGVKAEREENVDFWARQTATSEAMMRTLTHVVERYGGLREYVQFVANVGQADVTRLCAMLVDDVHPPK